MRNNNYSSLRSDRLKDTGSNVISQGFRAQAESKNDHDTSHGVQTVTLKGLPSPREPSGDSYSNGSSNAYRRNMRIGSRQQNARSSSSRHSSKKQHDYSATQQAQQLPMINNNALTKRPPTSNRDGNSAMITEEYHLASVASIKGLKPGNPNWTNQDNFIVIEQFDNRDYNIYCVLDGHGEIGHHVSRRCRESFPQHVRSTNYDIRKSFALMQNELNSSDMDVRCSGATCVFATLIGRMLTVYNCGDSRAVLGRRLATGGYVAIPLSTDHKPDHPEERKRILSCGGHLGCRQAMVNQAGRGLVSVPVGPTRVWYQFRGDTMGLAMSRSLGDSIVHKSGVSADPEIMEHAVEEGDEFVIIATDGIWDVIDNSQAVQLVQNFSSKGGNWSTLEAANWLAKFARSRWEKMSPMVDDITCIIIRLSSGSSAGPSPTHARRESLGGRRDMLGKSGIY